MGRASMWLKIRQKNDFFVFFACLRPYVGHPLTVTASDDPEPEFSSSSRAELEHFNFRAETELTICTLLGSKFFNVHY